MSVIVGENRQWGTLGHVNRVICGWWLPRGTAKFHKSDTRKTQKKVKKRQ